MADYQELKANWREKYQAVPENLAAMKKIAAVATAFNTNIDAVLKISGKKLAELIQNSRMSWEELHHIEHTKLLTPNDVLKGIMKCFERGIAEEWLSEEVSVYQWMKENLGYDRLQMGGNVGIVSNALAACGVQKVYVHANSLPKIQAEQFLKLDNLRSFDENGEEKAAYLIDRCKDLPLIHWIIEFDRGDAVTLGGHTAVCPKANRFIATYDPLNLRLVIDPNYEAHMQNQQLDFVVLSGFHALTANADGLKLLEKAIPLIDCWRANCDGCLMHLELASTQDEAIRKAIIKKIAPLMDSIGVNEREAIDVLEIINEPVHAKNCEEKTCSRNLFEGLVKIKETIKCPRIQLHMYGLYITLQDKGFKLSPERNLQGMMTAASVAAHKAKVGNIDNCANAPLWSFGQDVSEIGLRELGELSEFLHDSKLLNTGISTYKNWDIIAVPTILVEKPVTLVGMGDTISSISLVSSY